MGMHHDGMHFYPLAGSSTRGLLATNHEYTDDGLPIRWKDDSDLDGTSMRWSHLVLGGDPVNPAPKAGAMSMATFSVALAD